MPVLQTAARPDRVGTTSNDSEAPARPELGETIAFALEDNINSAIPGDTQYALDFDTLSSIAGTAAGILTIGGWLYTRWR